MRLLGEEKYGMVLAGEIDEETNKVYKWSYICKDGFGPNEVNAVCKGLGFESGYSMIIDPSHIKLPSKMPSFPYREAKVPCFPGHQLAVACGAEEKFVFKLMGKVMVKVPKSKSKSKKAKQAKITFAAKASVKLYGVPMMPKIMVVNRNKNGDYKPLSTLKYKKGDKTYKVTKKIALKDFMSSMKDMCPIFVGKFDRKVYAVQVDVKNCVYIKDASKEQIKEFMETARKELMKMRKEDDEKDDENKVNNL